MKKKAAYLSVTLVAVLGFVLASFISSASAQKRSHALTPCGPYTECTTTTVTTTVTTPGSTTGTVADTVTKPPTTVTTVIYTSPSGKPKTKVCKAPKKLSFQQHQRGTTEVKYEVFLGRSHKATYKGTGKDIRRITFKFTTKHVNLVTWLADGEVVEHFYSYNAKKCIEVVRRGAHVLHPEVTKSHVVISKVTPIYG